VGGKPGFRDSLAGACHSEGSAQTTLTLLPSTWTTGTIWANCPLSAYGLSAGGGTTAGTVSATPASLALGNVLVGSSNILPDILKDVGSTSVTISQATVTGTGFSINGLALPLTLAGGSSTSFSVKFAPTATGSVTGNISLTSNASNSPTNIPLSGTGVNSHYVSLSWTASSSSNIAGYNLYRAAVSGGPYTKLNSSLISGTTYTDSSVLAGLTYYYVSTSVNTSNLESAYSNQSTTVVPSP